jgi:hypothetical protein
VPRVVADHIVAAKPSIVWDAVTDWGAQSQWVLATSVQVLRDDGRGVGEEFEAFTGVGRLGVRDPMRVTEWHPPWRCVVDHQGNVVRGRGVIEVVALPHGRSRLVWTEDLHLPLGAIGQVSWWVARPVTLWGIRHSLRRFAALVEAGCLGQKTSSA